MTMIKCEVTVYQPGTGTRHDLIHGVIDDIEDCKKLGCQQGSLFLAWERHGSYIFTSGCVPDYLAEKLNIKNFMLDAIALTQFIRVKLGQPLMTDREHGTQWLICPKCSLPIYHHRENDTCMCEEHDRIMKEFQ